MAIIPKNLLLDINIPGGEMSFPVADEPEIATSATPEIEATRPVGAISSANAVDKILPKKDAILAQVSPEPVEPVEDKEPEKPEPTKGSLTM